MKMMLELPFFDEGHRKFVAALESWTQSNAVTPADEEADEDGCAKQYVRTLGEAGHLRHSVPQAYGGVSKALDVRTLCIGREILAGHSALCDFAYAMQGLGSGPISLYGSKEQCEKYLPAVASGSKIAAFALSEEEAGSDPAAMKFDAKRSGDEYVLNGTKSWISNAGFADFYVVFARTGEAPGAKGLSAFIVDSELPGLTVPERVKISSPHPIGTVCLKNCKVPSSRMIGKPGEGFKIAMGTLDVFRSSVGAAALGFARRAFSEAAAYAAKRSVFGCPIAEHQMIQDRIASMAVEIDAAALLVYRAAWMKDSGAERVTREASTAKLYATEAAQRVIDSAVQIFGAKGVVRGSAVERLYRDIRPLRIYEGTSEIQKIVIARQVLKESR